MRVLGVHVSVQSGDRQGENRDERRKTDKKREKTVKRERDKRDGRKMIEVR